MQHKETYLTDHFKIRVLFYFANFNLFILPDSFSVHFSILVKLNHHHYLGSYLIIIIFLSQLSVSHSCYLVAQWVGLLNDDW